MGLIPPALTPELSKFLGVEKEEVEGKILSAIKDVSEMVRRFVWAGQYSFADRLAYAASRESVSMTLYEMMRISESASKSGREIDENVKPYVAQKDNVEILLRLIDFNLVLGLEAVRRAAILAMGWMKAQEKDQGKKQEKGGE